MASRAITTLRNTTSGAVALIAAWSSYSHMVHLVLRYGERPEVAYAMPFSVDGMLLVSTIVMADDKRRGRPVRPLARISFVVGVAASVAANIAAAHPTLGARIIDAWPALALLLVVEMLARPPVEVPAEHTEVPHPGPNDVPVTQGAARHDVPAEVPLVRNVSDSPQLPLVDATAPELALGTPASPLRQVQASAALRPSASSRATGHRPDPRLQAGPHSGNDASAIAASKVDFDRRDKATPVPPEPGRAVPTHEPAGGDQVPAELHRPQPQSDPPSDTNPAVAGQGQRQYNQPTARDQQRRPDNALSARRTTNTPPATHGTSRHTKSIGTMSKPRRSATATRALAHSLMQAEPHLTKTEIARRLDISTRRLRDVLAA